jgi:hypothetical protein
MFCTAAMTTSGFPVRHFSAYPRQAPTGDRSMQLVLGLGRALVAVGLFLGGAYRGPRVRRMVVPRNRKQPISAIAPA